jgi:SAM-dependent methyltransferase
VAAVADEVGIADLRLTGMDVTPGMIELATPRLAEAGLDATLGIGDILDRSTYGDVDGEGFDLIFTFDVVQQLPRARQFDAVATMVSALRPGGTLTMFDHDRETSFGRRMGLKKWLTRHGPYPFVPRWYIHAAYPPLERFARRLAAPGRRIRTVGGDDTPRRVLLVERAGS